MKESKRKSVASSISLGLLIQEDLPEIADLYREGYTQIEIVHLKKLNEAYHVPVYIARAAVQRALSGHSGGFKIDPYPGLLSEKERKELEKQHRYEGRRRGGLEGGNKSYRESSGIFSEEYGERSEVSRRNALKSLEQKVGIHGLSREERIENSRKAVEARGDILWMKEGELMPDGSVCKVSEEEYAYELSQRGEYKRGSLRKMKEITKAVNEKYGRDRSVDAVRTKVKKTQEK
jgi:hypothetical protein